MFGLGMPEILMILAIALIVIGPKRLPDLAKTLGRAMGEFKRATTDFKNSIDLDTDIDDIKPSSAETRGNIKEANESGKKDRKTDSESKDSSVDEAQKENGSYTDAEAMETSVSGEDTSGGDSLDDEEKKKSADRRDSTDESNEAGTRVD